jgi:hypothetical protein
MIFLLPKKKNLIGHKIAEVKRWEGASDLRRHLE